MQCASEIAQYPLYEKYEYGDAEMLILWYFMADTSVKHPIWKPVVNTYIMSRKRRREEDSSCILTAPTGSLPIQMVISFC
jgi:hypothetical protein